MTTHSLAAPPRPAGTRGRPGAAEGDRPVSERTLDAAHLVAMREARAALHDAARRGGAAEIDAALPPFVHAMWAADFTRQTIRSLVGAAVDAGLPTGRGAARRAQRAAALAHWVAQAEALLDDLDVPRRRF